MANKKISTKKLKAIVFTDIVDFTKMSAEDEQQALDIIDKQREMLKPIVIEHKGEWLKEIGDGLLFSFDSSLDAVQCSIQIQEALKDINDFKIRIGIHQGDIFIKDGDVYGDDVNIASRVEGFSPEGGISISDKVYKDIQGVKEIKTSFIGHKPLKGVSQETKVRCITSNDLPKNNDNLFPKLIGYGNMYSGVFMLFFFSLMIAIGNFGGKIKINYEMITPFLISFFGINIGLVLLLFGHSTLSFYKGVSIKSQKFIYYLGVLYFTGSLTFILGTLNTSFKNDDGASNVAFGIISKLIILIIPVIIFSLFKILNKRLKRSK